MAKKESRCCAEERRKIRIVSTPPGFAPKEIREQWIGVEIPLSEKDVEPGGAWTGTENIDGFVVFTEDAVQALRDFGRHQAADFWDKIASLGSFLRFGKDFCRLVP